MDRSHQGKTLQNDATAHLVKNDNNNDNDMSTTGQESITWASMCNQCAVELIPPMSLFIRFCTPSR